MLDVFLIDHNQAGQVFPLIADDDGIRNIRRKFKLVFNHGRRNVLAARRDNNVLEPIRNRQITFLIKLTDITGMHPAVNNGLGRFLG